MSTTPDRLAILAERLERDAYLRAACELPERAQRHDDPEPLPEGQAAYLLHDLAR
jgi:hypothetical protein